jgi:hypothetical protein
MNTQKSNAVLADEITIVEIVPYGPGAKVTLSNGTVTLQFPKGVCTRLLPYVENPQVEESR